MPELDGTQRFRISIRLQTPARDLPQPRSATCRPCGLTPETGAEGAFNYLDGKLRFASNRREPCRYRRRRLCQWKGRWQRCEAILDRQTRTTLSSDMAAEAGARAEYSNISESSSGTQSARAAASSIPAARGRDLERRYPTLQARLRYENDRGPARL